MPRKVVRLAVVNSATGRHCGGWRIWTKKNDTYIAPLEMGDRLKVSLHDQLWRVAFTSEHWASGRAPRNAPGPGRSVWEIEDLPHVRNGVQHAWFIAVPPNALLRQEALRPDVEQVECSTAPVYINVWICDVGVRRRPQFPISPSPLKLADGRLVWVGCDLDSYDRPLEANDRPIVATMVEFSKPAEPGATPGFVVRPVDVD